jgi:hypothetical protein
MRTDVFPPVRVIVLVAVICAGAPATQADECPDGNLILGARVAGVGTRGHARVLADQYLPPEGTPWDSTLAVALADPAASVTVDLGAIRPITALAIQADADDSYLIEGSTNGSRFSPVWLAPPEAGRGLRLRGAALERTNLRYLRVRAAGGDGNFSASELIALCRPPQESFLHASVQGTVRRAPVTYGQVLAAKLAIAVLGLGLFLRGWVVRRRGARGPEGRAEAGALALLGVAGALCWWNLGAFHYGTSIHHEDVFHHFLGVKYFEELGYDGLYECAAAADAEAGLEDWVSSRTIRDLRTNAMVPGFSLLERARDCRAAFSPDRWRDFTLDVAWFRTWIPPPSWDRLMQDHGYNATPVWGLAGRWLARNLAASDAGIHALAMIDPLLLVAMWALVIWGFGWRAAAVAALWWGTNLLGEFGWTGGGFLRQDWLLLTVAGLCLVKRRRWAAGGWALAWAALLRLYPLFLAAGLGLKTVAGMWRRRSLSLEKGQRRFVVGFASSLAFFVALSSVANPRGVDAWADFARNSRVDLSTRSTNQVGLGVLLSYDSGTLLRTIVESGAENPVNIWQETQRKALESRRWLQAVALLAFSVLLLRRVRDAEDGEALVLGVGLVPLAVSISSYYASIFLLYGLLWEYRREAVALPLCALAAWTQCALLIWPQALRAEERYFAISLGLIATTVLLTAEPKPTVPRALPQP